MGPSTCCLCAWHGVYQAAKKNKIKKCIEPYLFMSRLNSGFTFHSRYQHKKKRREGGGGICKIDRVAAFVSNAALTSHYGSN